MISTVGTVQAVEFVYDLVSEAGSTEAHGVRTRHARFYGVPPGFPPVMGKRVHVAFDGGRMTSDCGILLLAGIERRLKISGNKMHTLP